MGHLHFHPHPHPHRSLFHLLLLLSAVSSALADDASVILKLANSLSPLPSGWSTFSSSNFCEWDGIECDSSGSSVTSISLPKRQISGTLPSELSSLSNLRTFSVINNKLSGSIPSLANLANLQTVVLESNNFTSMPSGFFKGLTALQTFTIGFNPTLSPWEIPADLMDCTSLETFAANDAHIVGSIPDVFSSLPSLQNLRLSYNNLTGALPHSMAGSEIQNLWLNNQQMGLSGSIDVLSSMSQLTQVWLHKNQFTGPIPDLSKCVSIFDLQLRDNLLSGVVPTSIISLPKLINVSLSSNKLQGPVPTFPATVTLVSNYDNNYCANAGVLCDQQVNTLLQVAEGLGYPVSLSDKWKGNDACNGWSFITCDSSKKVITVNFAKQSFSGGISPAFANLTSLVNLYLNDNNLTGKIPDSLTTLAQLKILDVSNNNLSGKIPQFPSSVKFTTTPGNPFLGKDLDSSSSSVGSVLGSKVSGGGVAIIVISLVVVLAIILLVFLKFRKRNGGFEAMEKHEEANAQVMNGVNVYNSNGMNGHSRAFSESQSLINGSKSDNHMVYDGGNVISIEVLREVTDNFSESNVLGRGGFGIVYKGQLHDGTKIAVKRMESSAIGTKGMNEFQAEIAVLTKVRHRHLVALLGYCVNNNEKLLVYEHMSQGTLGEHLFEYRARGYSPLTWKQRIAIVLDVARGVEYLHSLAQQSFIHRDLKPSNILLDDDMRAKVSDFGLVKSAPDGNYSVETRLAGTFGYLAPEYATTGRVTTKVDVFAFGVILMEIITGRKALDDSMPDESAHLVSWFRRILNNKDKIEDVIDKKIILNDEALGSILKVAELAGHCTAREPTMRPDMGHAVNVLAPLVEQWKPASQKEEEGVFGIDLNISLSEAVEKWQTDDSISGIYNNR